MPNRVTELQGSKGFWRAGPTAPDFFHIDVLPTFTQKATEYIRSAGSQEHPYFLYYPLPAPHTPILPTAEFRGLSRTNLYGDFCTQVDAVVGQILAAIAETGQADNTIVVFASDNGCSPRADFGELAAVGHRPSYIFRGHKADIYDGGHRIPLLVRWPNQIPTSAATDQLVCLSDLLATASTIIGDPLPDTAGEDSVSNLRLWRAKDHSPPVREAAVHHSIDGSFSIRQGQWKLEMCPGSGGWSYPKPGEEPAGSPPIQLYDMHADVGEKENLYDQYPEVVDTLTQLLTKYVKAGRSTPGTPQPNTGVKYWPQLNWLDESDT